MGMKRSIRRLLVLAMLAILALAAPRVLAHAQNGAQSEATPAAAQRPVLLTEVDGVIGPPLAHHIENAIDEAEARNGELLILQINTPGGLETSMREIIADILDSRVPVIGYVAPAGGRAASAGTYILYATHVAAMAPGTNVGAATPVNLQSGGGPGEEEGAQSEDGEDAEQAATNADAVERKAVNDAAAFMRSLAELRERNSEWGELAVRGGEAISANEALQLNVIDIVATDVADLLAQIDGLVIALPVGERTLSTQGALVERIEPSLITQALSVLANPNLAFLLMMLGVYGMIFEFTNPGFVAPGVIGAVCLVLGLYALNLLPLNYAGLALIILGLAFMAAEAFTPSFGILGLGGGAAFVIGAFMLIDTDIPEFQLRWEIIALAAGLSFGFLAVALGYSVRAHRKKIATGREALVGARGEVMDWASGKGHVWTQSERWRATGPDALEAGRMVRVVGVDELTLRVADETDQGDSP
jgi:membrane-bound serine protease (ClpP class)